MKLVVERSKLINKLEPGRMLVIKCSKEKAFGVIEKFQLSNGCGRFVDIAAVNSTEEVVIAGKVENVRLSGFLFRVRYQRSNVGCKTRIPFSGNGQNS